MPQIQGARQRDITDVYTAANEAAQLALTVQEGDVCVRTDENKSYMALNATNGAMSDWQIVGLTAGGGTSETLDGQNITTSTFTDTANAGTPSVSTTIATDTISTGEADAKMYSVSFPMTIASVGSGAGTFKVEIKHNASVIASWTNSAVTASVDQFVATLSAYISGLSSSDTVTVVVTTTRSSGTGVSSVGLAGNLAVMGVSATTA